MGATHNQILREKSIRVHRVNILATMSDCVRLMSLSICVRHLPKERDGGCVLQMADVTVEVQCHN